MRALLPALAVLLAACSDPGADLSPDDAFWAANAAAEAGEARRALALLESAAERGHLDAMDALADAHRDGYVRPQRGSTTFTAFLPMPWEGERAARRWRDRHERTIAEGVADGDPDLLLGVANELRHRGTTPAERDSADALYASLLARGHAGTRIHLALMSWQEDPETADSLLARAEADGSGSACHLRVSFSQTARTPAEVDTTAAGTARVIDALEACPPLPPQPSGTHPAGAEGVLVNLRENAARGDARAAAHLDSLSHYGVFERHPRLAAL